MAINKNTIWTVFLYLCALMSPNLFVLLGFSKVAVFNLTAGAYLLGAVVLSFVNWKTDKTNTLSKKTDDFGLVISLGLIAIVGSFTLQIVLALIEQAFLGQELGSQNTAEIRGIIKESPFFILAVSIGGPIMEEFVFRFSLINFLKQKLNIWLAAIISSLMFAAIHGDGHYLIYSGLGFFFFLIYKKSGSLITPIIAHAGMNTIVILIQLAFLK